MTDDINKGFDRNAIIILCAPGFGHSRYVGPVLGDNWYVDHMCDMPIVVIGSAFHDPREPHNPFAMHDIVAKHMEIMFDPKNQPGEIPEVILDDGFMVDRGKNTALKHVKRDWELRDRRGKKR